MARESSSSNVVVATLLFAIIAFTALLLLLSALVVWLAALFGSLLLSLVVTGVAMAVVAFAIYQIKLHPILAAVRNDWESVVEVVMLVRRGYNFALESVIRFLTK